MTLLNLVWSLCNGALGFWAYRELRKNTKVLDECKAHLDKALELHADAERLMRGETDS